MSGIANIFLAQGPSNDPIYVHSISDLHTDTGYYVHGSLTPRAPAATVTAPSRSPGDLLLAYTSSPGGAIGFQSTNGSYVTDVQGANNWRILYARTATGDADDDYLIPESSGSSTDQQRERYVQIICIKATEGTPTVLGTIGAHITTTGTYDYEIADRELSANQDVLTIANYHGTKEVGGSIVAGPYSLNTVPSGATEISSFVGGLNQPNAKYWACGWSYEFMSTPTTLPITDVDITPSYTGWGQNESSWIEIVAV